MEKLRHFQQLSVETEYFRNRIKGYTLERIADVAEKSMEQIKGIIENERCHTSRGKLIVRKSRFGCDRGTVV